MTDPSTGDPTRDPAGGPSGVGGGGAVGPSVPPAGPPQQPQQQGWRPTTAPAAGHGGWVPPPAGSGAPVVPHCYRHPNRETYVSCQRCGRPICPDCMRPAAVGFHCPEESGAGARDGQGGQRREPRTSLGGRVRTGRQGLVTQILISLCVVAYVLQGMPGLLTDRENQFTADFMLYGPAIVLDDQYYRLVTAAFLHGGVVHILFNLYALFLLGYQLEGILGRRRFVALFVACAVGGNCLSYLVNGLETNSLGASTAIFGFFGAFYVIARRMRVDTTQILIVIGINFAITFTLSNIDVWGHVGGLVVGVLVGLLYAYVPPRRAPLQLAGVVLLIGLLFVAAIARTNSIELPGFA